MGLHTQRIYHPLKARFQTHDTKLRRLKSGLPFRYKLLESYEAIRAAKHSKPASLKRLLIAENFCFSLYIIS